MRAPTAERLSTGVDLLHDPVLNKGTAFTEDERDALGLRGLLPPGIQTQDDQVQRVMENFRKQAGPLEKYNFLVGLRDRNETLFYRVVLDHLAEMHAHHLHADRRSGVPGVRAHLPPAARPVRVGRRSAGALATCWATGPSATCG